MGRQLFALASFGSISIIKANSLKVALVWPVNLGPLGRFA